MINLQGKRGVVLGVGNEKSIAWSIVESLAAHGAEVALTYLPDHKGRFEANVRKLAEQVKAPIVHCCDVRVDADIQSLIQVLNAQWGELDFLIHSLAFAEQEDLRGGFSKTSREGFLKAQEISAYSLLPLSAGIAPMMQKRGGGTILTMTFIGSVLAVPSYNVMGPAKAALESSVRYLAREFGPENIRVNAVSAGPIRTLSAAGIKGFSELMEAAGERSALRRNVLRSEVAETTSFLCSPGAAGITGQVIYVDCGYNIMGN